MLWDNQSAGTNTAYFIISYSDDENPLVRGICMLLMQEQMVIL